MTEPHYGDGYFAMDEGLVLCPGLEEAPFTESGAYARYTWTTRDMGNGYLWYGAGPVHCGGHAFHLSVCFGLGKLKQAMLSMDGPDFPSSWDDWTEQAERKRKRAHDKFLAGLLGRQPDVTRKSPYPYVEYNYEWGTICSSYDPRSASSSISISYKL